jgi:cytidine deaminase
MDLDPALLERLIEAARSARGNAHAPYSGFKVGAAWRGADGRVFAGCNVENASYGLSVCAERNAVAAAVAAGATRFEALAVVTSSSPPAAPCGACRQVLAEFGDLEVVLVNPTGERRSTSLAVLHPWPFRSLDLASSRDPRSAT